MVKKNIFGGSPKIREREEGQNKKKKKTAGKGVRPRHRHRHEQFALHELPHHWAKGTHLPEQPLCCFRFEALSIGSSGDGCFSQRYNIIAPDSNTANGLLGMLRSTSVGVLPLGFIATYAGAFCSSFMISIAQTS